MKRRNRVFLTLFRKGARSIAAMFLLIALVPLMGAPPANAQRGARVRALNLADMVKDAGVILRGKVLSVKAEKHPQFANADTVVITLEVREVLKGQASGTYTFRQYVWDVRDANTTLGYKVGEEMLLMLTSPSEYGLSSPVGFEQGRFRFQTDSAGNSSVANGWNNLGLMRGVETALPKLAQNVSPQARVVMQKHKQGPIAYTEFKDLIRGAIAARQ